MNIASYRPNKLASQNRKDSQIAFALCVLLFVPNINNFLNSFFQLGMSIELSFLTPICYILMAFVSVFIIYRYALRHLNLVIILSLFFVGVLISYLIYPEIRTVIYNSPVDLVYSPVNKLFFFCIPAMFGMKCLSDHTVLWKKIHLWARMSMIAGIVAFVSVYLYAIDENLQYMVYSYFMLLPICVCYEYARTKASLIDLALALVGTVCIIGCGARGAILSLLLFFVVRILATDFKQLNFKTIIRFFLLGVGILAVAMRFEEILSVAAQMLDKIGIESRFISKLTEGVLFEDDGRSALANSITQGILHNPFGYGLFGDRYVSKTFGYQNYSYVHNIALELLCQFGIIAGSMIMLVLVWKLFTITNTLKSRKEFSLFVCLLPYGLFQLLFSSSYLENILFFAIMGICFLVNWKNKPQKQ